MSAFQSSTNLQNPKPTKSTVVSSTASSFLASNTSKTSNTTNYGLESHPTIGKWYIRSYGLGPHRQVKQLTRRSALEYKYGKVGFRTMSGSMPVVGLNFGPSLTGAAATSGAGGSAGGGAGALLVAAGPRVSMYGGFKSLGTSELNRALKPGSSAQKRREKLEEEEEGEVDLFGGKASKDDEDDDEEMEEAMNKLTGGNSNVDHNLDSIEADRQLSTGGLLAQCAVHRSDGRLIAIGTEGGMVKICDAVSRGTLRTFQSNSGNTASAGGGDRKAIQSVAWLRDGKRVVAGGDDGVVRIWSVSGGTGLGGVGDASGANLTLAGHGDSVRSVAVVSFRKDEVNLKSKKGKISSISGKKGRKGSSTSTHNLTSVDDAFASSWSQLVISGSYDHTIRVWDIESSYEEEKAEDRCLSVMNHGDPVQALLVLPPMSNYGYVSTKKSDTKLDNLPLVVSAGGTVIKIWNPLTGTCLGTFPTQHAKTITSMCLLDLPSDEDTTDVDPDQPLYSRRKRHILTGGLDGLLRIHSATNHDILSGSMPFLHGMQISEPISALAFSQDCSRFAIGTTTGVVFVHQRRRSPPDVLGADAVVSGVAGAVAAGVAGKRRRQPRPGTYSYFMRGAHEKSHDPEDYLLMHQKKQKLAEYDVLLRKFRYGDALDKVLETRQPQVVIAVIEELGKRRGLTIALSNRDEESLEMILAFTIRFIDNPQYTPYLIGVAHILCDIYGSLMGQSVLVDELFSKLREKVGAECKVQRMLLRLLGQIDFLMGAAESQSLEELHR